MINKQKTLLYNAHHLANFIVSHVTNTVEMNQSETDVTTTNIIEVRRSNLMDQSADKLPLTIHLKRVIFSVASPCERNTIQLKNMTQIIKL